MPRRCSALIMVSAVFMAPLETVISFSVPSVFLVVDCWSRYRVATDRAAAGDQVLLGGQRKAPRQDTPASHVSEESHAGVDDVANLPSKFERVGQRTRRGPRSTGESTKAQSKSATCASQRMHTLLCCTRKRDVRTWSLTSVKSTARATPPLALHDVYRTRPLCLAWSAMTTSPSSCARFFSFAVNPTNLRSQTASFSGRGSRGSSKACGRVDEHRVREDPNFRWCVQAPGIDHHPRRRV